MDNRMQKKFVANTFEKIKEETKKVAEEVSPTKFAEDVAEQTGLKPQERGIEQPQTSQPAKTQKPPADEAARKVQKRVVTAQRLRQLEEEIKIIRQQREREEEEVRKGTPEENVESGRKVGQLIEEKKKEELPPPVLAAKRKTGTGERRIKGPSG
jgi:hypothetical protein